MLEFVTNLREMFQPGTEFGLPVVVHADVVHSAARSHYVAPWCLRGPRHLEGDVRRWGRRQIHAVLLLEGQET